MTIIICKAVWKEWSVCGPANVVRRKELRASVGIRLGLNTFDANRKVLGDFTRSSGWLMSKKSTSKNQWFSQFWNQIFKFTKSLPMNVRQLILVRLLFLILVHTEQLRATICRHLETLISDFSPDLDSPEAVKLLFDFLWPQHIAPRLDSSNRWQCSVHVYSPTLLLIHSTVYLHPHQSDTQQLICTIFYMLLLSLSLIYLLFHFDFIFSISNFYKTRCIHPFLWVIFLRSTCHSNFRPPSQ